MTKLRCFYSRHTSSFCTPVNPLLGNSLTLFVHGLSATCCARRRQQRRQPQRRRHPQCDGAISCDDGDDQAPGAPSLPPPRNKGRCEAALTPGTWVHWYQGRRRRTGWHGVPRGESVSSATAWLQHLAVQHERHGGLSPSRHRVIAVRDWWRAGSLAAWLHALSL